ncbi:hypothetical protein ACHAPI_005228 [Fusarium lateritium]
MVDVAGPDFWDPVSSGDEIEKTSDGRKWKCLIDRPFKDIRPASSKTMATEHFLSRNILDGKNSPVPCAPPPKPPSSSLT